MMTWIILVLLGLLTVANGVSTTTTYHSQAFRVAATGIASRIDTITTTRSSDSTPSEVSITLGDPDTLELSGSATDTFAVPPASNLFCSEILLHYAANGNGGGGTARTVNSMLEMDKNLFNLLVSRAPHAIPYLEVAFFLPGALETVTDEAKCETNDPCTGDVTKFLRFPQPRYTPAASYPNYLTLTEGRGIEWNENKVETSGVFEAQPSTSISTYDGRVVSLNLKLSIPFLRTLKSASNTCHCVHASWHGSREWLHSGWYPTGYSVTYDEVTGRFTVSLDSLQWFDSFNAKLNELQRQDTECKGYKASLEALLLQPKNDKVIINHEFAGMLNTDCN